MQDIVVIGYGNPLRGDDGFGGLAAEFIEERHLPGLEVIISHQLTPEMTASISTTRYAIFLDAVAGDEPGALSATPVEHCDPTPSGVSHYFEPGSLLALSKEVYGKAPSATLITATARTFRHGADVSRELREAAVRVANAVAEIAPSDITHQSICRALATVDRKHPASFIGRTAGAH